MLSIQNVENRRREQENDDVTEADIQFNPSCEAGLRNLFPKAWRLFSAKYPLAEVPSGVHPDGDGKTSCCECGHAEEQGANGGAGEGMYPANTAENMLQTEDDSNDELCDPKAERLLEPSQSIAVKGQLFAAGECQVGQQGKTGRSQVYVMRALKSDMPGR